MKPRTFACLAVFASALAAAPSAEVEIQAARLKASISRGAVVSLADARGTVFVRPADTAAAARIQRVGAEHAAGETAARHRISEGKASSVKYPDPDKLAGGAIDCAFAVEAATGDVVISQSAASPQPGVWGVSWAIGEIPAEFALIVPGRSGVRLDADTPGDRHVFDYPIGWEAQLVIIEGKDRGFYVFADDAQGRYKRLTATRTRGGWRLELATLNDAPFDALAGCDSVKWRLNVYEGDWRVPARRYREWMQAHLKPVPQAERPPAWARDIRACVIGGLSIPLIEDLAKRLDPPQTLLYIPDWRTAGYDRNYPDYASPRPELGPFLERAHALGFRVMLHVNYFGVDPLNPLYKEFERFHVRSPWGTHEHEWWTWDRADPPIKFAYINPASSAWRKHFVAAMAGLCRRFPVDALHLDQTLCIYNDNNGRIDGMSMLQGSVALHEELRAALPQVALSGEGLNEVTCRHEAFAQRHVWGLDHSEGTWNDALLRCAHPVSSYLLLPFTTIYGYLGMTGPENGQLYAAWNEAYEHFGVIPTLRPSLEHLKAPEGFLRQFLDEASCWQGSRLAPDLDGPWPPEVAFPFRTAAGARAARFMDGRLVDGERVVSRTLRGVNRAEVPGRMPGWLVYDEHRLMGLDPAKRYPCFEDARDNQAFHFCELPEGLVAEGFFAGPGLAWIRARGITRTLFELRGMLWSATSGTRSPGGKAVESPGPLEAANGARFTPGEDGLFAHPPYEGGTAGGEAFARFPLQLPREGHIRFVTGVGLRKGAMESGRSDGVTFKAAAWATGKRIEREIHHAAEAPAQLELDLTPLAGRRIDLELAVNPGPAGRPSFDWALWVQPRVEGDAAVRGALAVAGPEKWSVALDANGPAPLQDSAGRRTVHAQFPGSVFLLAAPPNPVAVPADLLVLPHTVAVSGKGAPLANSREAGAQAATRICGGVSRRALFAHPPDHGATTVHFPMQLPAAPARFSAHAGIADGSKSEGVVFVVEANGREIARQRMLPGGWKEISADLSPWSGKPVVLSLTTDSDGSYYFDWALWGEPVIQAAH